jgi:hypothetical protein
VPAEAVGKPTESNCPVPQDEVLPAACFDSEEVSSRMKRFAAEFAENMGVSQRHCDKHPEGLSDFTGCAFSADEILAGQRVQKDLFDYRKQAAEPSVPPPYTFRVCSVPTFFFGCFP